MSQRISRRLVLFAPLFVPALARAQAWPDRPVRLIVPFGAGGSGDTIARLLQPKVAEMLGQPLVIENRAGAGGSIGATAVARAPADGNTLLLDAASHVVAPLLVPNLSIDYVTAFTPVARVVVQPYAWAVSSALGVSDMAGFLALARSRAQPLSYGTPGNGSIGHLAGEAFAQGGGFRLQHIPYRGGAEAANDLASGTLDATCITISSTQPIVDSGRARLLALTGAQRSAVRPEVPTIAETAVPDFDVSSWNGVFGPARLPPAIAARLAEAFRAASSDPATRARLATGGFEAAPSGPEEFAALVQRDRVAFTVSVRRAGLAP